MLISRESREGGRAGLLTRCHRPSGRQASLPLLPPSASIRPSRCRRSEMQICPAPMKGLTELPAINMLIVFESRDSGLWEWLSSRNDPETLFPGGYFPPPPSAPESARPHLYITRPYAVTRFSNAMVYDSLRTARRDANYYVGYNPPGRMRRVHKRIFLFSKRSIKINFVSVTFC